MVLYPDEQQKVLVSLRLLPSAHIEMFSIERQKD
jgi:hypothetical protein